MNYYYPINEEIEVNVYKYINPKNQDLTEYWKVTTNPNQQTILTESFNSEFNLYNTFEERIVKGKAELFRYIDYEEITKELRGTVKKNEVYKSSKSESCTYLVECIDEQGNYDFEKKRSFVNFKEIKVQEKKYQTAKFNDEYTFRLIGINNEYGFKQNTYYALGIGMVKYERFIPDQETRILELEHILSEDEFNTLKKEAKH